MKKKIKIPRKPRPYRAKPETFKENDRLYIRSDVSDADLCRWCMNETSSHPDAETLRTLRVVPLYYSLTYTSSICYVRFGPFEETVPRRFLTKNPDGMTLENVMPDTRDLLELLGDFHA